MVRGTGLRKEQLPVCVTLTKQETCAGTGGPRPCPRVSRTDGWGGREPRVPAAAAQRLGPAAGARQHAGA